MPFARFFQMKSGIGQGWGAKHGDQCIVISTFTQEKVQECRTEDQASVSNVCIQYMRSVQKVSSHVIWKRETLIEEDTRNIVHRTGTPQCPSSRHLGISHNSPQSPSAAPSYFPESHQKSEISSLSKVILVLGKPEVTGHQIWAVAGLSHVGDLMVHQKTLHEMWCMSGCVVMMKLPISSCP